MSSEWAFLVRFQPFLTDVLPDVHSSGQVNQNWDLLNASRAQLLQNKFIMLQGTQGNDTSVPKAHSSRQARSASIQPMSQGPLRAGLSGAMEVGLHGFGSPFRCPRTWGHPRSWHVGNWHEETGSQLTPPVSVGSRYSGGLVG